jgi:hypothetical protein
VIEAIAAVSFADTPLEEMAPRANQILSLGWTIVDRGDPWVIFFAKHVDESGGEPEAELRDVMGDYWVDGAGMTKLLASTDPSASKLIKIEETGESIPDG